VPKWPQKKEKQHKETVYWLIWSIPSKGMCLMLGLGAYFQA
jgi:hypothetical protein